MSRIYIAGPLSSPDPTQRSLNVRAAVHAGIEVYLLGHVPYIPHLTAYVEDLSDEIGAGLGYEDWMRGDFEWLQFADGVLCLGSSPGTDREIARAERLGIPIYHDVSEIPPMRAKVNA